MKNKSDIDIILIILIILLILTIAVGIKMVDKDSLNCLNDPVGYYEHMKNASCKCSSYNPYKINVSKWES